MKWVVSLVAAVALAPLAATSAVVQFAAPAGSLPTGHLRNAMYDAVLPSGRIVTPFGASIVTGVGALGFALSPDGRYAIVSHADAPEGGSSLAVVDLAMLRVADRFAFPGETYFAGVAAVRDPRAAQRTLVFAAGRASHAVFVLDLDVNGRLTPDVNHVIPIAGPFDPTLGDFGRSVPGTLVAAPDGRSVYAVDAGADKVFAIDAATRAVNGTSRAVGFFPFGAALAGDRLLVANEGLMRYAPVPDPALAPVFAPPVADVRDASSISFVDLASDGGFAAAAGAPPALALDPAPDGLRIVGGAHPAAVAVTPDGAYAFVAMTNVDRIATVALAGPPRVVGGTELRLFDGGPYGTQPAALALSADGTRLYVALAGLDAVAVLDAHDPTHLHRLGLVPTGWFPSALALSADDRTLYVLNTNGFGYDRGFAGGSAGGARANALWSTLQKIDLSTVALTATTLTTLKNTRDVRPAAPTYPRALRDVVVIVEENKTFDAMLGDLGNGPAEPTEVNFGDAITPNLHALARRFALAGNFFADAGESDAAHQFMTGGIATVYAQRGLFVNGGGPGALGSGDQNPEDAPRAGSIFNDLERHHLTFRDYGDLVRLAGYDGGGAVDPAVDDPAFAGSDDRAAPTHGLGGRYTASVPAPAVLGGHVDLDYPGWNLRIRDERRAREFIRDYTVLVRAHRQPRYTHIWLPADHTGSGPDIPPMAEEVADGDRALGAIVQYLTRLRSWKNTAIFVLPAGAQDARDHVDARRTYAIVISPFAKPHYVGMRHLSTVSVLKTVEQILGLPPLALGDLLATDMSDYFAATPNARPYAALSVPAQSATAPRSQHGPLPMVDAAEGTAGTDQPETGG